MIGALIDHLAGRIAVLDFGDRHYRHLALLRPTQPGKAGGEHGGGNQSETR